MSGLEIKIFPTLELACFACNNILVSASSWLLSSCTSSLTSWLLIMNVLLPSVTKRSLWSIFEQYSLFFHSKTINVTREFLFSLDERNDPLLFDFSRYNDSFKYQFTSWFSTSFYIFGWFVSILVKYSINSAFLHSCFQNSFK